MCLDASQKQKRLKWEAKKKKGLLLTVVVVTKISLFVLVFQVPIVTRRNDEVPVTHALAMGCFKGKEFQVHKMPVFQNQLQANLPTLFPEKEH